MSILLLLLSLTLQGRVVGVYDGDTYTLLVGHRQYKIRMADIDAPEKHQPFGKRSKQALSGLIFGKDVKVVVKKKDRYGRYIGETYVGDVWVNKYMVCNGYAWAYRRFLKGEKKRIFLDCEEHARENKLGLWKLPPEQCIEPEEYRRMHKRHTYKKREYRNHSRENSNTSSASFKCGTKTKCSQMTSCEEAKFYLNVCGVKSLDRDGDGVPCERLCGG